MPMAHRGPAVPPHMAAGLLVFTVMAGGAACHNEAALLPSEPPPRVAVAKGKGSPVTAAGAIEDALTRVLPSLEGGGPVTAIQAGLSQILSGLQSDGDKTGLRRALREVQDAVANYQSQAEDQFQPDVGALVLALMTVGAQL